MNLSVLPRIDLFENKTYDGSLIKLSKHCKNLKERCIAFYSSIKDKNGIHVCPYGFSCYVNNNDIYIGLKISGNYRKNEIKMYDKVLGNPVLTQDQIISVVENERDRETEIENGKEFFNKTNLLLHDARTISSNIKYKSEQLYDLVEKIVRDNKNRINCTEAINLSLNIFHMSSIITNNFTMVDILLNPESLTFGTKIKCDLYKKFDKCRKIMEKTATEKQIKIKFHNRAGPLTIEAFQAFDLVPYILIDNAIKYSEANTTIDVSFEKKNSKAIATLVSIGPAVEKDEIDKIFEYQYRGINAKDSCTKGNGIGLYLANAICKSNEFKICAKSTPNALLSISKDKYDFSIVIEAPIVN